MRQQVRKQALEMADPMGDAGDVGMQADRHDPGDRGALRVQPLELVDGAAIEAVRGELLQDVHRDVVGLEGIGDRDERSGPGLDHHRLVVEHPVRDVQDALLAEQVGRLVRLGQTRALPAAWCVPVKRSMVAIVSRIAWRWSSSRCIGTCTKPWPMNSQPAASPASTMRG